MKDSRISTSRRPEMLAITTKGRPRPAGLRFPPTRAGGFGDNAKVAKMQRVSIPHEDHVRAFVWQDQIHLRNNPYRANDLPTSPP
jgi:hypothetical protein